MINKILIPVDGSTTSAIAVNYGLYIAPRLEASLSGLHVIDILLIQGPVITDISTTAGISPYDGYLETIETSLKEKADGILRDFDERCRSAGLASSSRKTVGTISDSIIEEAQDADLVLMARKGEHFHIKEGGLLGSVAESVIRRSGKPVLVTPDKFIEIESMGLAYDGSASARKALMLSLDLSEKTKWPITVIIVTSDAKKAADLSREVEDMAQQGVADCETIISSGKESDEIMKFIREGAVELMVMGAYGHNRLRELLLGSTTSYILQKSPIPVLLIR